MKQTHNIDGLEDTFTRTLLGGNRNVSHVLNKVLKQNRMLIGGGVREEIRRHFTRMFPGRRGQIRGHVMEFPWNMLDVIMLRHMIEPYRDFFDMRLCQMVEDGNGYPCILKDP